MLVMSINIACADAVGKSLEAAYSELLELEDATSDSPGDQRRQRLSEAYARDFSAIVRSPGLSGAASSDLDLLLRAGHRLAFYSNDRRYLDDMTLVMKARRSASSSEDLRLYHATLVQFRDFDAARRLAQEHPGIDLEPVPLVQPIDAGGRADAYAIGIEQNRLREIDVATDGDVLLAIVHPLCGFSLRAMQDLRNSPLLRDTTLVWMAPVAQRLYYDVLQQWNVEHPDQEIVLARATADWPMIDDWATPNFYLLRNGQVLSHFSGWPKTGNWQALRDLLAAGSRQ